MSAGTLGSAAISAIFAASMPAGMAPAIGTALARPLSSLEATSLVSFTPNLSIMLAKARRACPATLLSPMTASVSLSALPSTESAICKAKRTALSSASASMPTSLVAVSPSRLLKMPASASEAGLPLMVSASNESAMPGLRPPTASSKPLRAALSSTPSTADSSASTEADSFRLGNVLPKASCNDLSPSL